MVEAMCCEDNPGLVEYRIYVELSSVYFRKCMRKMGLLRNVSLSYKQVRRPRWSFAREEPHC